MTNLNIEPNGFYYQIPDHDPHLTNGANLAIQMGALASRLAREERTRTNHIDGRPENVAEHSYMLAKTATAIAAEIYPGYDRGKIALYSIAHDDIEAYVRDVPTDRIDAQGRLDKDEREAIGAKQFLKEHAHMPEFCKTVREYMEQRIPETRLVRVTDKITVLLNPNQGRVIKENYTREEFLHITAESDERLRLEYPELDLLVDMRTELASHLADLYLPA